MKPSFLEGAAVAAIMSVAGSVLYRVEAPLYGNPSALHGVCAALGCGYMVYLLARSDGRSGRVTLAVGWALAAAAIAVWNPSLSVTLAAHLALIWLVRVLRFHSHLITAAADLVLSAASLLAAAWALLQTGSVLASLWVLWLVQAAFVLLPAPGNAAPAAVPAAGDAQARFERAARTAEAALRALSRNP